MQNSLLGQRPTSVQGRKWGEKTSSQGCSLQGLPLEVGTEAGAGPWGLAAPFSFPAPQAVSVPLTGSKNLKLNHPLKVLP